MRGVSLLVLALGIGVACKMRSKQESQVKILQGKPSSHSFVLSFQSPQGTCSSVLIGYNLLLTSAHCLMGHIALDTIVFPEVPGLKAVDLAHVYTHEIPKDQSTRDDLAVLILNRSLYHKDSSNKVERRPVRLWDPLKPIPSDGKYVIIGYGNTELTGEVDENGMSIGTGRGNQTEGTITGIIEQPHSGQIVHNGWYTSDYGVHRGDSGGGLFAIDGLRDNPTNYILLGITSRGWWKKHPDKIDHKIQSIFTKIDQESIYSKLTYRNQPHLHRICGRKGRCGYVGPSDQILIDTLVNTKLSPTQLSKAWLKSPPFDQEGEKRRDLAVAILNYLWISDQIKSQEAWRSQTIKLSALSQNPNILRIDWKEGLSEDPVSNQKLLDYNQRQDPSFHFQEAYFEVNFDSPNQRPFIVKKVFLPVFPEDSEQ